MSVRRQFLLAAALYTTFAVYGSLVPLQYVDLPWDEAWARFRGIQYLQLGVDSRADWVANLLLYVPLTYLWTGVAWSEGRRLANGIGSTIVLAGGLGLSLAVEFTQVFFPQRTVSVNDVVAQSIGALLGCLLWHATGNSLLQWLQRAKAERAPLTWMERVLHVYLFVFLVYSLMPLDLTISPVELFRKWDAGRVLWLPFSARYDSVANGIYDLVGDALIWLPVACLWRLIGRHSTADVIAGVTLMAVGLEFLQLFVYSRVTDTTDVVTALLGGILGAGLGARLSRRKEQSSPAFSHGWAWTRWAVCVLMWLAALTVVFWFPWEMNTDRSFMADRLRGLFRVPFSTYYFGTEYRAITEVLRKLLFFMPGGALGAWAVHRMPPGALRRAGGAVAAVFIVGVALVVELGQVVLPGKVPDATDWFLESVGGLLGAIATWGWLVRRHATGLIVDGAGRPNSTAGEAGPSSGEPIDLLGAVAAPRPGVCEFALAWRRGPVWAAGAAVAMVGGVLALAHVPGVPYNVRELLGTDGAPWLAMLVGIWLLLWSGSPALVVNMASPSRHVPFGRTFATLLALSLVSAVMLLFAAPMESVHDVVGTPVFGGVVWPELVARLSVLMLGPIWAFSLGHAALGRSVRKQWDSGAALHLLLHGLWVIPLWHEVVVSWAATDNLTELMSGGGDLVATLCLMGYGVLVGAAATPTLMAVATGEGRWWRSAAVWSLASLWPGWLLVQAGTESVILKYGQVFSALQFLLSPGRDAYAQDNELFLRFAAAHMALLCLLAAGLFVTWTWLRRDGKSNR